jgi:hypothetical protein
VPSIEGLDKHALDARMQRLLSRRAYDSVKSAYYGARTLARRNPGRGRLLPDFLIIGSTRSGSTSLHDWLMRHPFVAPTEKEIHFFNFHYHRRADWYRSHFPLESERAAFAAERGRAFLVGEGTASYLAHYWSPARAAALMPEAKLIVCLRDPVDRAYSQYHYRRRRDAEPLGSFEEAIAAEPERVRGEQEHEIADPPYYSWTMHRWGYLRTGRYAEHLERWFAAFPRERFLFLSFENELVAAPQRALDRIHEFLGLPPHQYDHLPALNAGTYEPMADDTRERLREYFRPQDARLYELTGIDFGWPR